ncbi:hypothetical protein ACEQ8H_000724 [Pleosporales sp. CAS-2024a]
MSSSSKDYYDIPLQWIPSSNFANRPTSEISEINMDGVWTFMSSSESSLSSTEDEDAQTPTSHEGPGAVSGEPNPSIIAPQPRSGLVSNDVDASVVTDERLMASPLPMEPGSNTFSSDAKMSGSFSQRARVRRTLDEKKVKRLNTDMVDLESRGLLSAPRSILNTPRELYAMPEKGAAMDKPSSPSSPSSPQAQDARRCIMSSLSGDHFSLHMRTSQHQQLVPGTPRLYPKRLVPMYLPGPIVLEKAFAQLRKDSVASLDPFTKHVEPRVRRHSDLAVMDSMAAFFDDLGVMEEASEECLDMFWQGTCRVWHDKADSRRSSILSVGEPVLSHAEAVQSGPRAEGLPVQGSRFSFSSASSSSTSLPRNGTPTRQRDKLRRLLSPAFAGSAFLRAATPSLSASQGRVDKRDK